MLIHYNVKLLALMPINCRVFVNRWAWLTESSSTILVLCVFEQQLSDKAAQCRDSYEDLLVAFVISTVRLMF